KLRRQTFKASAASKIILRDRSVLTTRQKARNRSFYALIKGGGIESRIVRPVRTKKIKLRYFHILASDFNVFVVIQGHRQRFPQRQRMLLSHINTNPAQFRQWLLLPTIFGSNAGYR